MMNDLVTHSSRIKSIINILEKRREEIKIHYELHTGQKRRNVETKGSDHYLVIMNNSWNNAYPRKIHKNLKKRGQISYLLKQNEVAIYFRDISKILGRKTLSTALIGLKCF